MQLEKYIYNYGKTSLMIGVGFLFIAVLAEYLIIIYLNSGHLVYTLDDPYIHLAMAEHIRNWHYGVNSTEFSAPSSSILWPFILAPLSGFPHNEYLPLLINIIAAIVTVFFFWKILIKSIHIDDMNLETKAISFLLILLLIATNTVGLIFSGMEHSLQLLFVVMVVFYLISEIEDHKINAWLIVAILIAPLIRYENLAVSMSAVFYLFIRRYYKLSILLATLLILFVGGFSIFLVQLGLGPFPTSVLAKSPVVSSIVSRGVDIKSVLFMWYKSSEHSRVILLSCGLLCLVSFIILSKQEKAKKLLAGAISLAVVLHLFVGGYGHYHRYEVYIWSVTILTLLYLNKEILSKLFKNDYVKIIVIAVFGVFVTCLGYIANLITIPLASNNIYEQQYQMHRFAVEYYGKPVAVNDLGYISYKNNNYVLDLAGLACSTALAHRKNNSNCEWLNNLVIANNIQLVMIYDSWFPSVPSNWIKIGELHLGKRKITPAFEAVAFYAMSHDAYKEILEKIRNFQETLPNGVEFVYAK